VAQPQIVKPSHLSYTARVCGFFYAFVIAARSFDGINDSFPAAMSSCILCVMDPIITMAEKEREEIQRTITKLKERLAELDAFFRTYSSLSQRVNEDSSVISPSTPMLRLMEQANVSLQQSMLALRGAGKPPTIKDLVLAKVEKILQDGMPRPTRALVDALGIMGVPLRASDKVLQVSKILSNDPRFVADRSKGWTLTALKTEGPDVDASEPSLRREPPTSAVTPQPQPQGLTKRRLETS
jgi:hypothetical protein